MDSHKHSYKLTIPARINILGNPSDGVEGDFATISAAVDVYAYATIEPASQLVLEQVQDGQQTRQRLAFDLDAIPLPYTGQLDLVKGALNRLYRFSPEFRQKFHQGMHLATWTNVPRQSGLGGSSLFVLLALAGLRAFYDLDQRAHNDYVLAELAQRVEAQELGITCGYADRYVPLFGGIAYLDYHGKLYQQELDQEPFVAYERLDPWVQALPLVAISTGVTRDSGDVHSQMRPRYLQEHDDWLQTGGPPPPMVRFMRGAWQTAWRGKTALLQNDLPTFGKLMNENHRLVNEMMTYCGFAQGAGWANNLMIETALQHGALGAKLTGAGGGGSVFALVNPGDQERLVAAWQSAAQQAGLTQAEVYCPKLVHHGLTFV